ncbi:MAG TPA: hypothetical protein VNO32_07575 [Candidatus Acidoferrum sp.]|nr:hypothetical protein [Candidatus Acidoferrum sp.]
MRVRSDSVFISSLLHTVALLYLIRPSLWDSPLWTYFTPHILLAPMDNVVFRGEAQSVASLAIIIVGLIVVWTGYAKGSRPAWFVMFVIVWFWAFPRFILSIVPLLIRERSSLTFPELLSNAILGPGLHRDIVELHLAFLVMVIGLALPMRRVFVTRKADEPAHLPSRRLTVSLLIGIPVAALALYCWLRVGVLYEIPLAQMNASLFQLAPPPPPPSTPCKCTDGN